MDASLGARATEGDKGLLLDLGIEGVESLGHVVVKGTWLSVVLTGNRDNSTDLLWLNKSDSSIIVAGSHNTRVVRNSLLSGLSLILGFLDGKIESGFEARLETPVCTELIGILSLFILSQARVVVLVGSSAAKEIPIEVTVHGYEAAQAPKHPTTLTDHPHVGLTHVICDMEHHLLLILNILYIERVTLY